MKQILTSLTVLSLGFVLTFSTKAEINRTKLTEKLHLVDTLKFQQTEKLPDKRAFLDIRLDLGLNAPQNQSAGLSTSFWGSRAINAAIMRTSKISSKFSANIGIGVSHVRFRMDNHKVFLEKEGKTVVLPFSEIDLFSIDREKQAVNFEKSTFTQTFLDIPLELQYHGGTSNRSGFFMALGYKIGYNVSNKMKINYTVDGFNHTDKFKREYFVNKWRQALTFRLGWPSFHLFTEYSLTPIFQSNLGPENSDMQSFVIGISINEFINP